MNGTKARGYRTPKVSPRDGRHGAPPFTFPLLARDYILQADKQKEMTVTLVTGRNAVTKPSGTARSVHVPAAAACSVPVRIASRRDASPGRTARRHPLHSGRIAAFNERARPVCSASTNHGRDAFRRNATGGGRADKQKEMTKKHLALSDHFGEMASRRYASPGRTDRRHPLHSARIAAFDERARPVCCASTNHGREAFRRNATGGGRAVFLPGVASLRDATLPGLFCGSVIDRFYILQNKPAKNDIVLARNCILQTDKQKGNDKLTLSA
jgi:hypothetical protein